MRRWLVGVAVVSTLILVIGVGVWRMLRRGFSAHDEPTRIEASLAGMMRRWSTPGELRRMANPVALTPEVLAEARAHFADHCASCHGNDGKGKTQIGERLYPRAPDMTLAATQSLSDGELFAIIENGVRLTGMPGWGDGSAESGYGSWTLVHFIRHLPALQPAEIAEMEKLNPMRRGELEALLAEEALRAGQDAPPIRSPGKPEVAGHHH